MHILQLAIDSPGASSDEELKASVETSKVHLLTKPVLWCL